MEKEKLDAPLPRKEFLQQFDLAGCKSWWRIQQICSKSWQRIRDNQSLFLATGRIRSNRFLFLFPALSSCGRRRRGQQYINLNKLDQINNANSASIFSIFHSNVKLLSCLDHFVVPNNSFTNVVNLFATSHSTSIFLLQIIVLEVFFLQNLTVVVSDKLIANCDNLFFWWSF